MTTIAVKDGIVAYDSQIVNGSNISTLNFDKHKTDRDGNHYFLSGTVGDYQKFINRIDNVECSAIFVSKDGLTIKEIHYNKNDGYFDMLPSETHSIGTGETYAMGAMDAGATAKQAVKIAKKRDLYTGGKIRTFKIC